MRNRKVVVIGAGYVGSSIVYALMLHKIADEILLIDSNTEKAKAEVSDIRHGVSTLNTAKIFVGDYTDLCNCSLIIMTAGRNRRPGETRFDLKNDNLKIVADVITKLKLSYNSGTILVVTNPVDVITDKFIQDMELPHGTVFGTGCALDCSRLSVVLGDFLGVPPYAVQSYIIGGHGENAVILWDRITINDISLVSYCEHHNVSFTQANKDNIAETVRNLAMNIIKGKDRTHYGISSCVCGIADAVINGREIVSCVTCSDNGNFPIALPSIIGLGGIHERLTYMVS